jgi:hypothetical protein
MRDPVHEPLPPLEIDIDEFIKNLESSKSLGSTETTLSMSTFLEQTPVPLKRKRSEIEVTPSQTLKNERNDGMLQHSLHSPHSKRPRTETQNPLNINVSSESGSSSSTIHESLTQRVRLKIDGLPSLESLPLSNASTASSKSMSTSSNSQHEKVTSSKDRPLRRSSSGSEKHSRSSENDSSNKDTSQHHHTNISKDKNSERSVVQRDEVKEKEKNSQTKQIEEKTNENDTKETKRKQEKENEREKERENTKETKHETTKKETNENSEIPRENKRQVLRRSRCVPFFLSFSPSLFQSHSSLSFFLFVRSITIFNPK